MSNVKSGASFRNPWENFDIRVIVIAGLAIAVIIWSLLYFVDKPLPRRAEETPMQIAMNQPLADQAGWIGAEFGDVTPDLMAQYNLTGEPVGVFVHKILPDSPAELGGLKRGDIITSVDTVTVGKMTDFSDYMVTKKNGDRLKIRLLRKNKKQSLSIKLTVKPGKTKLKSKLMTDPPPVDGDAWLGLDVQSLDTVMVRQMRLPDSRGVIISYVVPGSPAGQIGLVRGDVVRTVDKTPVNDRIGFQEVLMNKAPGDKIKLEIVRNGFVQDVTIVAGVIPVEPLPGERNGAPAELPPADIEVEATWLGLTVVPVDPLEAKELGLPAGTKGIAVDGLSIGPAFDSGFQVGDVIMAINGMPTATLRQFKDATDGARGAMVDVWRGGRHRFVTIAAPGLDRQGHQLPNSAAASQVAQTLPVDNGMRYVAVTAMNSSTTSPLSPIFSKSPYYVIVDLKTGAINPVANAKTEATGIIAAKWLMQNHIDAVITGRIGPKAFDVLRSAKIPVYTGVFGSTEDIVQAFREGQLKPSLAVLGSQ